MAACLNGERGAVSHWYHNLLALRGGKAEGMVMVDEARKEPDRHALRSGF